MGTIVKHISPRVIEREIKYNEILLVFEDTNGARAFDEWFEFRGGSEAFAAWVKLQQKKEAKYTDVTFRKVRD